MKKNNIAIYGSFGSYTDAAARSFFAQTKIPHLQYLEFTFFSDLFDSLGPNSLAFFPIENSNGGSVTQSIDMFPQKDFEIIAEYFFDINHCLLGHPRSKLKDIKTAISHPQALAQSSQFLEKSKILPTAFSDSSSAAKHVADNDDTSVSAIGSELLAAQYNLQILKRNFQNTKNNITRFLLIKKRGTSYPFEKKLPVANKTTILFETKNLPGALYKCLGAFATNNINLTKIESRPLKEKNFHYFFIIDFVGNMADTNVQSALEELEFFTEKTTIFGSY